MVKLIPVQKPDQILPKYRNTPIERLFLYNAIVDTPPTAMAYDISNSLPCIFAYIIRGAGANMHGNEFEISYAIAVGGVSTIALLAHTDCGMSHVSEKRDSFLRGLVERAGCDLDSAARQFDKYAGIYQIGDSIKFILAETARLQSLYPKVLIAPLLYKVEDDQLEQIVEN